MILFKKPASIHNFLGEKKKQGLSIGFVPTMGALHEGHLSLIRRAVKENDVTVCSIYVNPAQFNDLKDLEKYPRSTEHDIEALTTSRCTILFLPSTPAI